MFAAIVIVSAAVVVVVAVNTTEQNGNNNNEKYQFACRVVEEEKWVAVTIRCCSCCIKLLHQP